MGISRLTVPLHTPVLLYKSEVQGGVHYTEMNSTPYHATYSDYLCIIINISVIISLISECRVCLHLGLTSQSTVFQSCQILEIHHYSGELMRVAKCITRREWESSPGPLNICAVQRSIQRSTGDCGDKMNLKW